MLFDPVTYEMVTPKTPEDKARQDKLAKLAETEGLTITELLEQVVMDSVSSGICTNPGCDYTTEVEGDQTEGYCEACGTGTVKSALILAGLI